MAQWQGHPRCPSRVDYDSLPKLPVDVAGVMRALVNQLLTQRFVARFVDLFALENEFDVKDRRLALPDRDQKENPFFRAAKVLLICVDGKDAVIVGLTRTVHILDEPTIYSLAFVARHLDLNALHRIAFAVLENEFKLAA
jgi:hypothetical protein